MTTYTTIADSNGDFIVPFSTSYSSGEKITITAEKDGASKTLELYAPSELVGEAIKISGSWNNFPQNIGTVTITMSGTIQDAAFWMIGNYNYGFSNATGLIVNGVSAIGGYAFNSWKKITILSFDSSLESIGAYAFEGCSALLEIIIPDLVSYIGAGAFQNNISVKKITLGFGLTTISGAAFRYLYNCDEIICKGSTPPTITENVFEGLKSACIFKVPSASLSAYQSAENWSAYAARMVGY